MIGKFRYLFFFIVLEVVGFLKRVEGYGVVWGLSIKRNVFGVA